MPKKTPPAIRAALAAVAAVALATTGAVAGASGATAATSTSNPFAESGGFSVYSIGDASFTNHEIEGSVAVGGELTVAKGGTFAILHQRAGLDNYSIPTIDGDPTRLFIGSYSEESGSVKISNDGAPSDRLPQLSGSLKVTTGSPAFTAKERAGWVRYSTDAASEQGPLIDATNQLWPGDRDSISTTVAGASVADYIATASETQAAASTQCLAEIASPTTSDAHHLTVAEDVGDRKVLSALDAERPNVIDYASIVGATHLQFAGAVKPGVTNPLIIRVPAGTTTLKGLTFDSQFTFSPYVMWDLSALSGAVSLSAGGRIDGSIYAPNANLTVEASPIDGQIIAKSLDLKGGEAHAVMFLSQIPCAAPTPVPDAGAFSITKLVEGSGQGSVPADTEYTVEYELNGVAQSELALHAGLTHTVAELPIGSTVTLSESTTPVIESITWTAPQWSIDGNAQAGAEVTFTVTGASTVAVTITNTAILVEPEPKPEPEPGPGPGTDEGPEKPTAQQDLASTGTNPAAALGLAGVMLLLGLGTVVAIRRGSVTASR